MATATNIVRLPTAAPRQVKNNAYSAQRIAARAVRQATPWPGEYKMPTIRRAERSAEIVRQIEQTPAMHIVMAMLATMDRVERCRIVAKLAEGVLSGRADKLAAFEAARLTTLNFGEEMDMLRALGSLEDAR
jgi:mannose/cellobiose epimerase-like protein (N-acyl-D-glucosamine 2-epimerase family)